MGGGEGEGKGKGVKGGERRTRGREGGGDAMERGRQQYEQRGTASREHQGSQGQRTPVQVADCRR